MDRARAHLAGRPMPGVKLKIVAPDGYAVKYNGGTIDPVPWLNARGIYLGGCGG